MKVKYILILFAFLSADKTIFGQANFVGSGLMLNFDGDADNYYDLGDNFNDLNFPITFEAWVNQTEYSLYTPVFATDSYTSGNYYGMYVRFDSSGKLIFEIGNGAGSGGAHRRGKITTTIAPLDQWIHICVVANSITDVKIYFNGVTQPVIATDGTASITTMVHNSNPASLGRYATVHRSDAFIGQIDEVRLWNIAKTEVDVRDKMCEKLIGSELGLIGYWIADGEVSDVTLNDLSITNADGIEIGSVEKNNSGAPIGDVSIYSYLPDYTFVTLNLNSPGGDKLKINKILNNPHGIHVYRVNGSPFSNAGLTQYPNYYYGVFTANNTLESKYTITYSYSYANGVATVVNESNAKLFKRIDGSIDTWSPQPATLTIASKKITKKNISTRNEFIFNVIVPNENKASINKEEIAISVYPQPASNYLVIKNVNPTSKFEILNLNGQSVGVTLSEFNGEILLDVSKFENGIYFINELQKGKIETIKFIVQH